MVSRSTRRPEGGVQRPLTKTAFPVPTATSVRSGSSRLPLSRKTPSLRASSTDADLVARRLSVGTSAADDSRERLQEDPQVPAQREVLNVVELDRQALGERQRPSPEDLHRAGDPWLHGEPEAVLGPVAPHELYLLRSRADDAHLTLQHVHELRQLVEAESSQHPPHAGDARIAFELEDRLLELVEPDQLLQHLIGAVAHGAELVDLEWDPAEPGTRLDEQQRPTAVELDRERDDREQRRTYDECERRGDHVEDSFDQGGRLRDVPGVVLEHWQVRHL